MNLTENEVTLIKVIRAVKGNERAYVSIQNRDDEMNLIFDYKDTFDYVSDEEQKESMRFIDQLRTEFPNSISGLVEYTD